MIGRQFFAELKRRRIYQVAAAYAVVGWLLIQVVTQVFPLFVPEWAVRLMVVAIVLGFPVALVIAWAAELRDPTAGQIADPPEVIHPVSRRHSVDAIAVLPLENLSGEAEEEFFADGMTEALITDLAKIGGLKVISRGSVMRFKGTKEPLPGIARKLGVDMVVEGSVVRSGERIRISARLVRAETDEYLWTERYDRRLADVLELQDEVARAVAGAIGQALHARPLTPPRRVDPEAFLLDLRGRHLWHQRTEKSFRAALQVFEDAAARDPLYAPAQVGIAESLNMLANYGFVPPREVRTRSLAAAHHTLELDPHSADAHRLLAFAHWQFDFAWLAAITEYERSLQLNPYSPATNYWFGAYLAVIGYFDRADELLVKAHELDPLSLIVPSVQGWARIFARRFDEALPYLEEVLGINPDFHLALWFQGEALVELGRYEDGILALQRAYEHGGRTSRLLGYLGNACARAGQHDRAQECLTELDMRASKQYVPPYFPALIHCGEGNYEQALDCLEQAHAEGDSMLRDLKADPQWDAMRGLPRFQELMRMMAYPDPKRAPPRAGV